MKKLRLFILIALYPTCFIQLFAQSSWFEKEIIIDFSANPADPGLVDLHQFSVRDLDGDGNLDIVLSVKGTASINDGLTYLLNDGSMSFDFNILNTQYGDHCNELVDLDSDGDLDIISGGFNSGFISVHENMGSWVYSNSTITSGISHSVVHLKTVDLNEDGYTDVVAPILYQDKIMWFKNTGTTGLLFDTYNINGMIDNPWDLDVLDFDLDGDLDIVCSSYYGAVHLYSNDGAENFTMDTLFTTTTGHEFLKVDDINRDGDFDLLVGGTSGLLYLENNGDQTFTIDTITSEACEAIKSGDIDGDGDIDICASLSQSNELILFENYNAENFNEILLSTGINWVWQIDFIDLDQNGSLDIMVSAKSGEKLYWFKNTGFVSTRTLQKSVQTIYPNPNNGSFTIENFQSNNVMVWDIMGKEVATTILHKRGMVNITLEEPQKGVYFIQTAEGVHKMVIE